MRLKAGLVGDPVAHSLSPRLFAALGADYRAIRAPASRLAACLRELRRLGYRGVNVTIPHKRAALRLASRASPEAEAVGAANVLVFKNGAALARNTDAAGFLDALKESRFSPRGEGAVVFGAGGAARAVAYALGLAGAREVLVCARRPAAALEIARALAPLFPRTAFSAGPARPAALWVNATPLGMPGYPDRAPFRGPARCRWAVDLVYGRDTAFLRAAKKAGARAADGSAMLIYQALRSFELFSGKRLSSARRQALRGALGEELR